MFNGTTGGFATVKGNFYVGNTGTGAVEVFNTNSNVSPMRLLSCQMKAMFKVPLVP